MLTDLSLQAQEISLGLKGGLNYSLNDKGAVVDAFGRRFNTDSRVGFQGGGFIQVEFERLFFRPEVFYNHVEGEFPFPDDPSLYSINKLSVPLLAGYNLWGPFSAYVGPAYQHFLSTEFENMPTPPENQQKNWAGQVGLFFEFRRFALDLRYDFTFDSSRNQRIRIPRVAENAHFDDGRLGQLMLSLDFKIFDSGIERDDRRRRTGSCYF